MRQLSFMFIGMVIGIISTLSGVYFVLRLEAATNSESQPPKVAQTAKMAQGAPDSAPQTDADTSKRSEDPYSFKSMGDVGVAKQKVTENPSAQGYAELLARIQFSVFAESDIPTIELLEVDLVSKLREQVKVELEKQFKAALVAPDFKVGSKYLVDAAGTLALYPMTEDSEIIDEAEFLSRRLNDARFRLELVRRARYNVWAASVIEDGLKTLRAEEDDYLKNSLNQLAVVEPSLLEPSTSSLYNYAIEQMMAEYNASEKANVAKALNDPSLVRKTLEAF